MNDLILNYETRKKKNGKKKQKSLLHTYTESMNEIRKTAIKTECCVHDRTVPVLNNTTIIV